MPKGHKYTKRKYLWDFHIKSLICPQYKEILNKALLWFGCELPSMCVSTEPKKSYNYPMKKKP